MAYQPPPQRIDELWSKFLAYAQQALADGGYVRAMECSEPKVKRDDHYPPTYGTVETTFTITIVAPLKAE